MIVILIVIVIFLIVIYKLNAPKIKGTIGKSRVARQLNKLQGDEYKVFNDILIRHAKRTKGLHIGYKGVRTSLEYIQPR